MIGKCFVCAVAIAAIAFVGIGHALNTAEPAEPVAIENSIHDASSGEVITTAPAVLRTGGVLTVAMQADPAPPAEDAADEVCPNCGQVHSQMMMNTRTRTTTVVSRSGRRTNVGFMQRGPLRRLWSGVRANSLSRRNARTANKLGGMQARGAMPQ